MRNRKIGLIEAATGIGKTIAVLAPVLDYVEKYNAEFSDSEDSTKKLKIVVLGRTHSQADRVIDEIKEIERDRQKYIRAVSKRGRQSMCSNGLVKSVPSSQFQSICAGYKKNKRCTPYNNSKIPSNIGFIRELAVRSTSSQEIWEESIFHDCCPAEISAYLLRSADVVSGSYHYLFNKEIRDRFLQSIGMDLSNLIVIIDEAHNLPNSTIKMNTLKISTQQLENAKLELTRTHFPSEYSSLVDFYIKVISSTIASIRDYTQSTRVAPLELAKHIETKLLEHYNIKTKLRKEMIQHLQELSVQILERVVTKHFTYLQFATKLFAKLFDLLIRKDHLIIVDVNDVNEKTNLELSQIDPSRDIASVLKQVHSGIMMTGTMGNATIFAALTGMTKKIATVLQLPSPYEQTLGVYAVKGLTSKYSERDPEMFARYVEVIDLITTSGVNVGLYVPSYNFLDALFEHGLDQLSMPLYRAERGMSSSDTRELIEDFRKASQTGGAMLCSVMGGRSSEGTDFPGKEMEIVVIAGIPYPPQSIANQAIFEYYSSITKVAWDICNSSPAFRQINQSAGRAVRSLEDRAVIFLLDDRIDKNRKRLTGWLRSNYKKIEMKEIEPVLEGYFS